MIRRLPLFCAVFVHSEGKINRTLVMSKWPPFSLNLSDTRRILHSTFYFKVEKAGNTEAGQLNMVIVRLFYLSIGVHKELVYL